MVEDFISVELRIPEEYLSIAYGLLSPFPTTGIEEGEGYLRIYFPSSSWERVETAFYRSVVGLLPPGCMRAVHTVTSRDWYSLWVSQLVPVWLSDDVVVHPFPEVPTPSMYPTARDILHIVPGTAFGTGHHASTRLAAQLLLRYLLPNTTWLDVGTGTGILGILALRRGAARVYAIDNNPFALQQAHENAVRDRVVDRFLLVSADVETLGLPKVDGIVANLDAELLYRLALKFNGALPQGGIAIVSGILVASAERICRRFEESGFEVIEKVLENDWMAFAFRKQ